MSLEVFSRWRLDERWPKLASLSLARSLMAQAAREKLQKWTNNSNNSNRKSALLSALLTLFRFSLCVCVFARRIIKLSLSSSWRQVSEREERVGCVRVC